MSPSRLGSPEDEDFCVQGFVRKADGTGVTGLRIHAADVDLRHEQLLGRTTTDRDGHYSITYTRKQFRRVEKGTADLRVFALSADNGQILAKSDIQFNAPVEATVDLVIGGAAVRGQPEYDKLLELITPVLDGIDPADLLEDADHQDISFLVGETGADRGNLELLVAAHKLGRAKKMTPAIFYGLFRMRLPKETTALFQQSLDALTNALKSAVDQNVIYLSDKDITTAIEKLVSLAIEVAASPSSNVGQTLKQAVPNTVPVMDAFSKAQSTDNFWSDLSARPETRDHIESLQFAVQLGTLTLNHAPLIQQITQKKTSGELQSFNELAKLRHSDWMDMIQQPAVGVPKEIPGDNEQDRAKTYATAILNLVEDALPTQFFMHRLSDSEDKTTFHGDTGKQDVHLFLQRNSKFSIKGVRISEFITRPENKDALRDIKQPDVLVSNMAAVQRLSAVAPRYTQISSLLSDGLTSSLKIARMGSTVFTQKYASAVGSVREAQQIYDRAEYAHSMAFNLLVNFGSLSTKFPLPILHNPGLGLAQKPPEGIPDWTTLFGSMDMCSCDGCRAMDSPAAYLVDLLHFLKDRTQNPGPGAPGIKNAKDVLFLRRPDIGAIELTCDNTNTPLPYIDLAIEILENAVSPPPAFAPFDLTGNAELSLNAGKLDDIRSVFTPSLSPFAVVTVIKHGKSWKIDEPSYTYNIEKVDTRIVVTSRSLQTTGSAAERAANPQYMNFKAYNVLDRQTHPASLPFSLPWETVRTYLKYLSVDRSGLMQAFQLLDSPFKPLDPGIAIEYLEISTREANIIKGITPSRTGKELPPIWKLWGFRKPTLDATSAIQDPVNKLSPIQAGQWDQVVTSRVDVFLHQSGLEYADLLNVLEVSSIFDSEFSPSIAASKGSPPDTCQLNQLEILGLSEDNLHSFIRFIRLWRKLSGWSMLDLAKVFRALHTRPSDIDDQFLVAIAQIQELHTQLSLSVGTVSSFFHDLETTVYIDHTSSDDSTGQKSEFDSIFNNRTVTGQPDLKLAKGVVSVPGSFDDHATSITAALNISSNDLKLLIGDGGVVHETEVSIKMLSALYRHTVLVNVVAVDIPGYLLLLKFIDNDPFKDTGATVRFIERAKAVLASGFSLPELNYLLRHEFIPASSTSPGETGIANVLDDMRARLQKIKAENTFQTDMVDEKGDGLKKKLALLSWDQLIIAQAIGALNGSASYSTVLASALPGNLVFPRADDPTYVVPKELQSKFTYDPNTLQLSFAGVMTVEERDTLVGAAADLPPQVKDKIPELFNAPRSFFARNLRSFSIPDYTTLLAALPDDITVPLALRSKFYYDPSQGLLHMQGAMSTAQRDSLLEGAPDPVRHKEYRDAVQTLYAMPNTRAVKAEDLFLSGGDVNYLSDSKMDGSEPVTPRKRFTFVLQKLLPYLLNTLSNQAITQAMIENLSLDSSVTNFLLDETQFPGSGSLRPIFRMNNFTDSALKTPPTRSIFPQQFKAFELLYKMAMVTTRFHFTLKQLKWIFLFRKLPSDPTTVWLDLSILPLQFTDNAASTFVAWERLNSLVLLRDSIPGGENTLDAVFNAARATAPTVDTLLKPLEDLQKYSAADLTFLVGPQGFNLKVPDSFKDEVAVGALIGCLRLIRITGCSASDAKLLAQPKPDNLAARVAVQAVKSKYDEATWESIARPLRNILREKQRAALVDYLLANQSKDGHFWHHSNDLFSYYLIDVGMGPCQLTSRIKQATCSTQLFVQRCLMNLEVPLVKADTQADPRWEEWKWMKQQNVHGANMKVLLNPENYMEPELRDDQTDFFKTLRNTLQQTDLTNETASNAFNDYLRSLDEVSRLQVVSYFHQEEAVDGSGLPAIDILHVIARTRAHRPTYYYRQRVDSIQWKGGWMKVEADIEGDHVLPIMWNRKLFLFWALFTQKQDAGTLTMPRPDNPVQGNPSYVEVGLAWSVLNGDKFSAKRTSPNTFKYFGIDRTELKYILTLKCAVEKDGNALEVQVDVLNGRIGTFRFNSINGTPLTFRSHRRHPQPLNPHPRTTIFNMSLLEQPSSQDDLTLSGSYSFPTTILNKTPGGPYELVCAPQDLTYTSQRPLFFQHDERCFFVEPMVVSRPPIYIPNPILLHPGWMDGVLFGKYVDGQKPRLPILDIPYPAPERAGPIRFRPSIAWDQGEMSIPDTAAQAAISPALQARLINLPIDGIQRGPWIPPSSGIVIQNMIPIWSWLYYFTRYKFSLSYHPFVKNFIAELSRNGIDGLMQRQVQLQGEEQKTFVQTYDPNLFTVLTDELGQYAEEVVDFEDGPYSIYNWELFFHIPLMIADRLSKNQKFADAQHWFHYIFDPTDTSTLDPPRRFWRTKKFFETTTNEYNSQVLPALFRFLASRGDPAELAKLNTEQLTALRNLERSVDQWRKNPFNPYLVAKMRTTAFQRMVVMKYLDNLIAWGDSLFRGNTIEKINEATQIYILASEILGERPKEIPPRAIPGVQTFNTLEPHLDVVSNALVPIEELVLPSTFNGTIPSSNSPQAVRPSMLFFCIPKNDKLLNYWDTIVDRLFKIRNCMNLQGIVQELPLFDPPIDPALLVKAAASGVDISSALSDVNAPLPHFRFSYMLQKALDICNELKSLGSVMLAALEKRDSESLALLRTKHEMSMNDVIKIVKQQQAAEAAKNLEALVLGKATVQARYDHYAGLPFMNEWETISMGLESGILLGLVIESAMLALAGGLFIVPDFKVGCPTTIGATIGGSGFGKACRLFAGVMSKSNALIKQASGMSQTLGSYHRRSDDWDLQKTLAQKEMTQMERQIDAAGVRQAISQQEVLNHEKQTQNSKEIDSYMRNKFNNADLYDWSVGQLSALYFQSYQLAYDVAKRAQRAYCNELGLESADFIQFGYWDSLKKGLVAGDKLFHDLKRMEMAYMDQDTREYEITSSISLAQLDPLALMQLREEQDAFFSLPEAIFDLSYPGHYMRRIKNVSLTIPCVVGPYASVNATLSILKGSVRTSPLLSGGKYARRPNDIRFTDSYGQFQSIVTSTGQNDSGLFETNLRDERTLPFERLGAISSWRIQLPSKFKQFDYRAMTDVIIHIRYTAREGGDQLRQAVESELQSKILSSIALAESQNGLARLISLRHEPNGLFRFLSKPTADDGTADMALDFSNNRFPFIFKDAAITIDKIQLFVFVNKGFTDRYNANTLQFWILREDKAATPASAPPDAGPPLQLAPWQQGLRASKDFKKPAAGVWKLRGRLADGSKLVAEAVEDVMLVCYYSVKFG